MSLAAPSGVQACDPRRGCGPRAPASPPAGACQASPCPCRKGRRGASGHRGAGSRPGVGAEGAAGSRGCKQQGWHGEERGDWHVGRVAVGRSSARCCWSWGEAGSWRGTWLSCWKCTAGRQGEGAGGQRALAQRGRGLHGVSRSTPGWDGADHTVAQLTEPWEKGLWEGPAGPGPGLLSPGRGWGQ